MILAVIESFVLNFVLLFDLRLLYTQFTCGRSSFL
jgi:hypothetical protein